MDFDQPTGAARVGAGLREVRERLGWNLADIAEALRIRLPYLEAIEQGELSALPGLAYQTGFVRAYAQILGLDAEEILRRFRAEGSMGTVPKAELTFLAPVPDRAVPKGALVFLGVVLVLAGYGLWYRHTEPLRKLAEAVPSVPPELAPLALPPKPVAPPAPAPVVVKPAPPAVVAPKPAPPASPALTNAIPAPAPATPPATASANQITPLASTPPAPGAGQVITATQDDWVEVRDATGNILFSKVLHAGESWPVPDEPGLTMTAGNAGGTEIALNGKAGPPLGATGTVLHGYALTPPAAKTAPPAPAN